MNQTELQIFDQWTNDPRLLIPFQYFLEVLRSIMPQGFGGEWCIFRGAEGYGEKVCSIEEALRGRDFLTTDSQTLLPVLLKWTPKSRPQNSIS
jgi:hypothetical protein